MININDRSSKLIFLCTGISTFLVAGNLEIENNKHEKKNHKSEESQR